MRRADILRLKRRRSFTALAVVLVLATSTTTSSGAFSGGRSANADGISQSAYTCAVDYASIIQSTPGLSNYWRLGESSGTTAVDQTGTADGTYVGGPTLGGGAAKPSAMGANTSMGLSGVSKGVNVGDVNDFTGTAAFTVEAWVNFTGNLSSSGYKAIAMKADNAGLAAGWLFQFDAHWRLYFSRWNNGSYAGFANSAVPLSVDKWHHVAVVSGTSSIQLYVDGVLQRTTSSLPVTSIPDSNVPLRLGWSYSSTNPSYSAGTMNGSLDEVAIYNRALTPAEIQSHTGNCTYASLVARTPGLQSYWRLDETGGTSATDSGSNNVSGTYVNSPVLGATGALPSGTRTAATFSTPASQYVNTGSNYAFTGTAAFSVEAWVKPVSISTTGSWRSIASSQSNVTPRDEWSVWHINNTGHVAFQRWQAGAYTNMQAPTPLTTGYWSHVVATYDGTTMRLYVNGALGASVASSRSIGAGSPATRIGYNPGGAPFDGSVDEVAIYDRALSASEIAAHYAAR